MDSVNKSISVKEELANSEMQQAVTFKEVKEMNEKAMSNKYRAHWKKIFLESCSEIKQPVVYFTTIFPPKRYLKDKLITRVLEHVWSRKRLKNGKLIRKNTMRTFKGSYLGAALSARGMN